MEVRGKDAFSTLANQASSNLEPRTSNLIGVFPQPASRLRKNSLPALVLMALLACGAPAMAAEKREASDGVVVKSEDGLRFKLPADWPVEKRNGILAPVPIEEYLSKKFSGVESRLQQLEQQINGFDLRLRVIEEELKKQQRLRSGEQSRP
ncbi:MAG: hypothetical protein HYZ92_05185 [Candidatus Omnitrophica bacterium]|nr:hypothetical protein [Candidatus Omnitrophota bacterium]